MDNHQSGLVKLEPVVVLAWKNCLVYVFWHLVKNNLKLRNNFTNLESDWSDLSIQIEILEIGLFSVSKIVESDNWVHKKNVDDWKRHHFVGTLLRNKAVPLLFSIFPFMLTPLMPFFPLLIFLKLKN